MKIVFCGEDSFSSIALESLIKANHKILAVFCPLYKNHRHARLEKLCTNHSIPFHRVGNINARENEDIIRGLNPNLISVCHFEKILKPNIIGIPSIGCINLHPSLLPEYRGLSPQHWPIINGDAVTGISIHFIDQGIDTGPIIIQHKLPIKKDVYVSDLQFQMAKVYAFIVRDAIELIEQDNFTPITQKSGKGSYHGKLKEEHCVININKGALAAYNLIRGVSRPYLGAKLGKYRIWRAKMATKDQNYWIQSQHAAEDLYFDEKLGAVIKFKEGSLIVENYEYIEPDKIELYEEQNYKPVV